MIIDAHLHLPCYDDTLVTFEDKKNCLLEDIKEAGVDGAIVIADSEKSSSIGSLLNALNCFREQKTYL